MKNLRNIAIIAHVDHGKTTIIDSMLHQSGTFHAKQETSERIMDSNDLEKERGITILAKCTSVDWNDLKINIVDTPGHADFGGEVERVLNMVDGVLLLVDAAEGPLPQTKFVLSKALSLGLRPIVILNKMDRHDIEPDKTLDNMFDLFASLGADEHQLDFPVLYAAGRDGWCVEDMDHPKEDLLPLFHLIENHVPAPKVEEDAPFKMLVTMLDSDPYLGRVLTGRITSGTAKLNAPIHSLNLDGKKVEQGRITKLLKFEGIDRVPADEAQAGDIISIAGLSTTTVADTICDVQVTEAVQSTPIDPPTMAIMVTVNDSPLAGKEGSKLTSNMIRTRLLDEAEGNVAIKIKEQENKSWFEVGGRGELQLGVLLETMRREGFELSVSRPHVLLHRDKDTDQVQEPIEEIFIDVDDEYTGVIIEKLNLRKGEMKDMTPMEGGRTRLIFHIPSRGLIGYQNEFLTDTRGTGVLNRLFYEYADHKGKIEERSKGALISTENGKASAYALWNLEDRGVMFINPQDEVYQGMVVGEHTRGNDLEINVIRGKKLTNVRASGTDENIQLSPPKALSLEEMISYIGEDELVEITPNRLRLRKKHLCPHERKKAAKSKL